MHRDFYDILRLPFFVHFSSALREINAWRNARLAEVVQVYQVFATK